MLDLSEILERHSSTAKSLQQMGLELLEQMSLSEFKPRDALELIKLGVDIERLCVGLETEHIKQEIVGGPERITNIVIKGVEVESLDGE